MIFGTIITTGEDRATVARTSRSQFVTLKVTAKGIRGSRTILLDRHEVDHLRELLADAAATFTTEAGT